MMLRLFTILLFFSSFYLGCKKADYAANKVANIPLTREVDSLDPAISYDTVSGRVLYQMYETLFEYHYLKRPYTLQPLLAKSMPSVTNNGKTYTIKIKENIRYHDDPSFGGKPRFVKAQDFVNQIKRLAYIPTQSTGWWLFDGKIVGINKFRKDVGSEFKKFFNTKISGIQTPDDYTLVFNLTVPYPQMIYALAMTFTSPLPEEAIRYYGNDFSKRIVGTGPFKLEKWNKLLDLKLSKFEHYHKSFYPAQGDRVAYDKGLLADSGKQIPFLDGVHFHIIKEESTRWLNFLSKKIDLIVLDKDNYGNVVTPSGELTPELKKDKIDLQVSSTLTLWWLSFNMKDSLVGKNRNLRLAIAHAINIKKYIHVFTNNVAQKANSIYPPGVPGYDPSRQLPYEYDLKKAKMYLKKAGYDKGKGLPIIKYDVRGNSTTARQMAEFIKAELEKIGIEIKIIINTFPGFLKKSRSGNLQFWQGGWAMDYPDAENILQLLITKNHSPGPNSSLYSDRKFDKLFLLISKLENGPEKFALMTKMETMINNDLPWIMQYYTRNYTLHHKHLKNFRDSDLINNSYKYLRISNN